MTYLVFMTYRSRMWNDTFSGMNRYFVHSHLSGRLRQSPASYSGHALRAMACKHNVCLRVTVVVVISHATMEFGVDVVQYAIFCDCLHIMNNGNSGTGNHLVQVPCKRNGLWARNVRIAYSVKLVM